MLKVSNLYIYPIKSLPGIEVTSAKVTEKGFEHDRRWLLVDENNCFLTQREHPQMTRLVVAIEADGLLVTNRFDNNSIKIPFNTSGKKQEVVIWDDTCTAEFVSDEADKWFTGNLNMNCRLVYMPDDTRRIIDQRYAPENSVTSFADAYPFLLIGQSSLDELNSRLTVPLPMDRFRPNIVFTGDEPFAEDLYSHFTISGIDFYGVKLCARCVLTTINQVTGIKAKEPLKTLAKYRFKNNKILFGQNLVHSGNGFISVGDELSIKSYNTDDRFIVPDQPLKTTGVNIDKTFV